MATVKFYLRRPKEKGKLKTSEVSIFLTVTIDKANRFELNTCEKIPPVYWNFRSQEVKPSYTGHIEVNQSLSKIKGAILQLWREHKAAGMEELKEMSKPLVKFGLTAAPEKKSFFPVISSFIEQYKRDKDSKTVAKYAALKAKLEEFNPRLSIDKLDNNFYDAFKNHLYENGLFDATVYKYFTNLSTVLTWAESRGHEIHYTKNNPTHKSWEIIKRVYEPLTLTLAELEKLETLVIDPAKLQDRKTPKRKKFPVTWAERRARGLAIARDFLVLECRTGQRISDLKRFDLKNVTDQRWSFHPKKGNRLHAKKITVPFDTVFTAPAWEILKRYNFQLPDVAEQTINENIKKVCKMAGIDQVITIGRWKQNEQVFTTAEKCEFLSTHTGRRTFITIALQFLKPKLVKDLAGISWNTLRHYEGQTEDQNLIDGLNKIPATAIMKTA